MTNFFDLKIKDTVIFSKIDEEDIDLPNLDESVSKTEDEEIDKDKSRKKYWKKRFVHYDIRPYDELKEDAEGRKASKYDEVIVASLPLILNFNNN